MTALLAGVALASGTLGGAVEVDLVGPLGVGPRLEGTWRLSPGDGGQRLFGAVAVVGTSEFVFVPISAGWRSTGRVDRRVAPVVGAGMQAQCFAFTDHPLVARHAWYAEAGARLRAREGLDLALVVAPELITFGVPGIGLAVRLGAAFGS